MREIKFRAWQKAHKKMHYKVNLYCMNDNKMSRAQLDNKSFMDSIGFTCEIMQFTGLQDKNGKDIYEGDIVKIYGEEIRTVEFKNAFWQLEEIVDSGVLGGFGTQTEAGHKPLYRYGQKGIEVIGNIHENENLFNS